MKVSIWKKPDGRENPGVPFPVRVSLDNNLLSITEATKFRDELTAVIKRCKKARKGL